MSETIRQLRAKWNKEKESYKSQELGTGIHNFIRACLESNELFSLKEGFLSGKPELKKKEYIHENKAKEGRRADFVVYINQDIVIPLEAECYGNIKAGIKQLFEYQKDFDKQYGILTDGFAWRFYNNNVYREFNLSQILEETDIFLEFWNEYIKPEFYYLSFFEPQGQLSLLKETDKLPVEENRQIFFDDITRLIRSFKNKLQVEGYFNGLEKKEREKRAIEITYAYIIQFILYKTLVDNEFGNFVNEFTDIVRAIHECLKVKQYGKILSIIEGISNKISQNIYRPFKKEQDFISQTLLNLSRKPKNELHEVSPWLDIFVFIKKYNFANIQNEIFGYIYENYLKELYEEEKKGQYFTDPAVVNFMLQQGGFTPERLQKRYQFDKDSISLVDPACGSGTFLYSAVDSIIKAFGNSSQEKSKQIEEMVNNNIFGLDIAEFPLYLAEMNILMRMLPLIISEKYNNPIDKKIKVFLTRDSVAEFMDTALKGGQLFCDFKDLDLEHKSYMREKTDLEEMKRGVEKHDEIPRRRFDFVISNPPYVSYNECAKQKVLILEFIKTGKNKLTNIYGINLHSIPGSQKKYSPKPNLYTFFIALGIALLKDNGKLCYIIPQTVLVNSDLDVVRYHLAKFTTIEKIITFSGKMFVGRGLKQDKPVVTSSLIFVISRELPSSLHEVEIINYTNPNDDVEETLKNILANKKITKKKILQLELLENVVNWNFIKQDKVFLDFYKGYKKNTEDMLIYYNHALAERRFKSRFYFDKGLVFPKTAIHRKEEKLSTDEFSLVEFDKRKYTPRLSDLGVCSKDIRIPQGSQGITVYRKKHKIVWSYMNFNHFYFSDKKIVLPYNFVIISSDNKSEILYLFSLLNSSLQKTIIEKNFRLEQEDKLSILLGIKLIKSQIRVPRITEDNQPIKDEIIRRTEEMLAWEGKTLSDFVDFSGILMQRFKEIRIEKSYLLLTDGDTTIKLRIRDNPELVADVLNRELKVGELKLEKKKISLSYIRSIPIVDFQKERDLKNYIDLLVFALYCNIPLEEVKFSRVKEIKRLCSKNKYFTMVTECQR